MSLAPGTRLGAYEIVAAIGAGGMGEVYRAHDSALRRDVAIKVMATTGARDEERLVRLEREARILASLNHPNIATIHGLEMSKAGPAIVLELVEGPTLEDRLARGPLPLAEALRCARQIADALDAAHELGIIHRDLKPANVKVRPDGTIKVLDFGIAKLLSASGPDTQAATTISATEQGALVGTPYYMSPEQARGEEVTRRADVWAFGATLFEMLTGKRAFPGAAMADVLAAIVQGSPDWSALPSATPPGVTRLVRRCLERDPRARLRDIGDARLAIEDEERALVAGSSPTGGRTIDTRARRPWALGVVSAIAIAASVTAVYLSSTRGAAPPREIRLQLPPPTGTHFVNIPPAISPDGTHIALVAAREDGGPATIWLRSLSDTTVTELPGTAGAIYPFWSPDNRSIGFFADGELKRMAAAGGRPISVCPAPAGRGGLWLDDDTIVFAPATYAALMRVTAAGGTPVPFTALAESDQSHRFPQRLPGRQLMYYVASAMPERNGIRIVALDAGQRPIALIPALGAAEYVNGYLLFSRTNSVVLAQQVALPDGRLIGEPVEVAATRSSETLGRSMMATAPSGVIATLGTADGVGHLTWTNRSGAALETVGAPASQTGVELSPDGQQVATVRSNSLFTMSLERPVAARATERGSTRNPVWSPDGMRLLAMSNERGQGTFDIVTIALASGALAREHEDKTGVRPMGWLRDGRMIWIRNSADDSAIWVKPPIGPPAIFLKQPTYLGEARVSPDGKWILYSTRRSGRFEIEVRSFPDSGPAYPVSAEGGGYPRWRADGLELYFTSGDAHMMAATFAPGTPPRIGKPARLFPATFPLQSDHGFFSAYEYDVNKDGSRFLVNRTISPPETAMSIIVNWNPRK